ncbi:hypothetical protein V1264_007118 [Littorina saxatilis]|uniref:Uncharacterized protein n=1 Tax=Littorina saxatilis TaxID=31220 RepID=A0AAN9G2V3_9CAEN
MSLMMRWVLLACVLVFLAPVQGAVPREEEDNKCPPGFNGRQLIMKQVCQWLQDSGVDTGRYCFCILRA